MNIVLLGPPGSGKGTHASGIAERCGLTAISAGDVLRAEVHANSSLGQSLSAYLARGELVPHELVVAIMHRRIMDPSHASTAGWVFDGFPRSMKQVELMREIGIPVDYVVYFQVSDCIVIQRLAGRRIHAASGRVYHTEFSPPKVAGHDDITGEALTIRVDDKPDVIKHRLQLYYRETTPLLGYYRTAVGLPGRDSAHFIEVSAEGDIKSVRADLFRQLPHHAAFNRGLLAEGK